MDRRIKKTISQPLRTIVEASSELAEPPFQHHDRLMVRRKLHRLMQACMALQAILDEDELENDRQAEIAREISVPEATPPPSPEPVQSLSGPSEAALIEFRNTHLAVQQPIPYGKIALALFLLFLFLTFAMICQPTLPR